jgi:hypothetical protein
MAFMHELVAARLVQHERLRNMPPAVVEDAVRLAIECIADNVDELIDPPANLDASHWQSCEKCGAIQTSRTLIYVETGEQRRAYFCERHAPFKQRIRPVLPTRS